MFRIPFEATLLVVPAQIVAYDGRFLSGSAKTDITMHLDIIGLGENGGSRCLSFGNYLSIGINFLKENILKLCLVGFMVHTGFGCIYPEGAAAGANVDKTVAANDAVGKFLRQALRHFSFTVVE